MNSTVSPQILKLILIPISMAIPMPILIPIPIPILIIILMIVSPASCETYLLSKYMTYGRQSKWNSGEDCYKFASNQLNSEKLSERKQLLWVVVKIQIKCKSRLQTAAFNFFCRQLLGLPWLMLARFALVDAYQVCLG